MQDSTVSQLGEEIVVEIDGVSLNLMSEDARKQLDALVDSPDHDRNDRNLALVYEAIDKKLRSQGIISGVPLVRPDEDASSTYYGYRLSRASERVHARDDSDKPILINRWKSRDRHGKRQVISIYEKDGKRFHRVVELGFEANTRFMMSFMTTLTRIQRNPVTAELKAQQKLRRLIGESRWGSYVLSESFIEAGKSGVLYLLRKGRPTIAMRPKENGKYDFLTALCLHPLGGYRETFAGAMAPSDEAITIVLLIRVDEHGLWKRANHLNIDNVLSGI